MKSGVKVLLSLAVVVLLVVVGGFSFFNLTYPKVTPAQDVVIEATPELLEHGKYLANHVTLCVDCHSQRDWAFYAGPIKPETFGAGGQGFTRAMGLPGDIYTTNITPTGLGDWSDGEIIRAIRQGVDKDGNALFPLMPYPHYKHMRDDDAKAIVAYLRTLEPKDGTAPERDLDFPMQHVIKMIPSAPEPMPQGTTNIERGKYLATIAACGDCHTPMEKGRPVVEKYLAGGQAYPLPGGTVYAANITPDKETGIGTWTKDDFVMRFNTFRDSTMQTMAVGEAEYNTVMPWIQYAGMTDEDLGLIYDYLMSVEPIHNPMERFVEK